MELLKELKERWETFAKSEWKVVEDIHNGVMVPVGIRDEKNKAVIHEEFGIQYGASTYSREQLYEKANAIAAAPMDIQILLNALSMACGQRPEKIEHTLQYARKKWLIDCGKVKDDTIIRDYR